MLFSNWYGKGTMSPLHPSNNVNGLAPIAADDAHTLANGALLAHQEAMVRKVVAELNAFDNVYFEIQNEPDATSPDTRDIPAVARSEGAGAGQGGLRGLAGLAGAGRRLDRRRGTAAAASVISIAQGFANHGRGARRRSIRTCRSSTSTTRCPRA